MKAQIKLRFITATRQPVVIIRSFQLTQASFWAGAVPAQLFLRCIARCDRRGRLGWWRMWARGRVQHAQLAGSTASPRPAAGPLWS